MYDLYLERDGFRILTAPLGRIEKHGRLRRFFTYKKKTYVGVVLTGRLRCLEHYAIVVLSRYVSCVRQRDRSYYQLLHQVDPNKIAEIWFKAPNEYVSDEVLDKLVAEVSDALDKCAKEHKNKHRGLAVAVCNE